LFEGLVPGDVVDVPVRVEDRAWSQPMLIEILEDSFRLEPGIDDQRVVPPPQMGHEAVLLKVEGNDGGKENVGSGHKVISTEVEGLDKLKRLTGRVGPRRERRLGNCAPSAETL
jgi:hypothetical protein